MNPRDVTPSVIIVEGASYPITPPLIADSLLVGTAGEDDKMLNSAHGTKGVPYESPIGGIALPPLGPIGAIALPKGAPMGVTEKYVLHSPPGYDTPTHHGLSLGVTVFLYSPVSLYSLNVRALSIFALAFSCVS